MTMSGTGHLLSPPVAAVVVDCRTSEPIYQGEIQEMAEKRTPHELGDMKPPFIDARELAKQGPAPGTKPGMADELIRRKAIRARSLSEFQVQVDKSKGRRSGKSPSHASNTVATPPVSIAELARALKDDADLIFQHVHNNIEFLPTWGIQKGSEGCLIDGFGNSFDQSKLLVDLLTEAGYTASFVKGVIRISLDQVQNWLGTGGADVWPSSYRLNDGQVPNDPVFVDGDGWTAIDIEHVWVEVEIDSITYVFDPAFKTYTTVSGIDLETATGYVQGDFLTAAEDGATIDMDGNWIEDVNAGNIADDFQLIPATSSITSTPTTRQLHWMMSWAAGQLIRFSPRCERPVIPGRKMAIPQMNGVQFQTRTGSRCAFSTMA